MRNKEYLNAIFAEFDKNFLRPADNRRFPLSNLGSLLSYSGLLATDILETPLGYEYHINTPGFKKEEINIDLVDGVLRIALKRATPAQTPENTASTTSTTNTEGNTQVNNSEVVETNETATGQTVEANKAIVPVPARLLYSERSNALAKRQYALPENADASKVEATYENGTLVLKIAKLVPATPTQTRIEIR